MTFERFFMKRDMDLIRQILLQAENCEPNRWVKVTVEGCDCQTIQAHIELLVERGLVKGPLCINLDDPNTAVYSLAWEGYDFLDACRDENRWNKAKREIQEKAGSVAFDVLKTILNTLALKSLGL